MSAPDCTDLTSGDQCNGMRAVGCTGSASTLTCNVDVSSEVFQTVQRPCVQWTASLSGMSHDCDRIAFLESCYANCSDGYAPVDVTSPTLPCGSNGFLVSDTTPFYPVCQVLSCASTTLLDEDTVEGLDCSSLTLGEACVVTCADGYTAAGEPR